MDLFELIAPLIVLLAAAAAAGRCAGVADAAWRCGGRARGRANAASLFSDFCWGGLVGGALAGGAPPALWMALWVSAAGASAVWALGAARATLRLSVPGVRTRAGRPTAWLTLGTAAVGVVAGWPATALIAAGEPIGAALIAAAAGTATAVVGLAADSLLGAAAR